MLKCCDHLDQVLPHCLDIAALQQAAGENLSPLRTVMLQEAQRLNRLVACVRDMVQQVRKGIAGLLVMSEDLENLQSSLLNGKVPQCWKFAFPSLKPLTSWATDLAGRVEQINKWGFVRIFMDLVFNVISNEVHSNYQDAHCRSTNHAILILLQTLFGTV